MKTLPIAAKLFLAFCFMLVCGKAYSQTNTFPTTGAAGIGTLAPDASALFEVTSTTQGVLVPRMTKNQRDNIVAPATGLLIYQTSGTAGFYYFDGSAWSAISFKNGANKTLANLTEPTAVNVGLLPSSTNALDLGSMSSGWKDIYAAGTFYLDGEPFIANTSDNVFVGQSAGLVNSTGTSNTAVGNDALFKNTTGSDNTALGNHALFSNNQGNFNLAAGPYSLYHNTDGSQNHAFGYEAMYWNSSGNYNVAIGYQGLTYNTIGNSNISIGAQTLRSNTEGSGNVAIGDSALSSNTIQSNNVAIGFGALAASEGSSNVAIGWKSLYSNTTGNSNTANGYSALFGNTTGFANTANGNAALYSNKGGDSNTANGHQTLYSNTSGYSNSATGAYALYSNISGNYNTANGNEALYSNTSGFNNTANGYEALYSNTTGNSNTANGYWALYSNISGKYNTSNGYAALYYNTTGNYNTANGNWALYSNTTGYNNTANGHSALYSNTTGYFNTAIGNQSLYNNTTGTSNAAIGVAALNDNTTGNNNTAIGNNALYSNTTGNYNTAFGSSAGFDFAPGDNCTFIGHDADATVAGLTNSTAIGNGALVIASNNMRFGNSSVIGWGFGASPSTRAIKVGTGATNGNGAYLTVGGVWTDVSDINKKENITELDKKSILEKIQQLKVSKWKYTGTREEYHIGPMAQEFHKLFEVGDDSSISSMDKTGVLFLGVQALSEENGKLKTENSNLQKQIDVLKGTVEQLVFISENSNSEMSSGFAELKTINSPVPILSGKPETLLGQNIPNPFNNSTLIPFRIPKNCHDASIMITNISLGEVISVIPVACNEDHLSIDAGMLSSGMYSYTLYVDGKMIDTKQMVIQK